MSDVEKTEEGTGDTNSLVGEEQAEVREESTLLGDTDGESESKDADEESKDADEESKEPEGEEEKVPDEYVDFAMPEGVELNEEIASEFKGLSKELGLTQEKAQKLIDIAAKNTLEQQKRAQQEWRQTQDDWVKEIKNDKEFGGGKFKETVERAKRTLKNFGDADITKFLDGSGFGNHPGLIRMLAKMDAAIGEDKFVDGSVPEVDKEKPLEEVLYGKK